MWPLSAAGKLSRNFSAGEFACRCGCHRAAVSPRLLSSLEVLRVKLGNVPIRITSGVRCEAHNAAVHGSPHSQHVFGQAVDIQVAGKTGEEIYFAAREIAWFRGIGIAELGVHLDVRYGPVSKWRYDSDGRVTPWPEGTA